MQPFNWTEFWRAVWFITLALAGVIIPAVLAGMAAPVWSAGCFTGGVVGFIVARVTGGKDGRHGKA